MVFDKFKDTLTSKEICRIVSEVLTNDHRYKENNLSIRAVPISDGGDGFIDCMQEILRDQV